MGNLPEDISEEESRELRIMVKARNSKDEISHHLAGTKSKKKQKRPKHKYLSLRKPQ